MSATGASASCTKCVKVLRELISGLQDGDNQQQGRRQRQQQQQLPQDDGGPIISRIFNSTSGRRENCDEEPPPLTLLKAIANPPTGSSSPSHNERPNSPPKLEVDYVENGVKLTIPVEATLPHLLRRWTKIVPLLNQADRSKLRAAEENEDEDTLTSPHHLAQNALATSANTAPATTSLSSSSKSSSTVPEPLTIELKCRKCASTGPEGGARAFLMGPQPLSVILCHNRIDSEPTEISEILTHELIHLYDVQTLQLDLQECENLAYSEVRAAKAAECRGWSSNWQPYCAKQKATNATHNLYPKEARSCVNRVFETAFNDNRPFKEQDDHSSSNLSSDGRGLNCPSS